MTKRKQIADMSFSIFRETFIVQIYKKSKLEYNYKIDEQLTSKLHKETIGYEIQKMLNPRFITHG
jgi:hypothetical protein